MDLNRLVARMAVELADIANALDTIAKVSEYAQSALHADGAGVLLIGARGRIETPTATSEQVKKAHQLQAAHGEGPCLAAVRGGDAIYTVSDTRTDERWPRWGRAAAELGYLSVVSASLHTDARPIGSLNVYAQRADAFDREDVEVLGLLADHATAAIAGVTTQENLRKALDTRTIIGQAQGILMATYDIDAHTAFSYMRRLSQDQNQKLVGLAKAIVEGRQDIGTNLCRPIRHIVTDQT